MWWWTLWLACSAPLLPPVDVAVGGCASWEGPTCVLEGPGEVVVWLPAGGEVRRRGAGVASALAPSGQGVMARLVVSPGDTLEVAASGHEARRLEFAAASAPAWSDEGLPAPGAPGWAAAVLARGEAGGALGRAQARLALLRGARTSEALAGRAAEWTEEALVAAREAGRGDLWTRVALQEVYGLAVEGRSMARARALVAEARAWRSLSLETAGHVAWAEGLIAKRTGDVRTASAAYREAVARYTDAGLPDVATARNGLAEVEQRAGRHREALALFAASAEEARGDAAPPGCWWSFALNDLAFALHTARRAGYAGPVDGWPGAEPAALLTDGLAAWHADCEDAPALWVTLHLNLAQVASAEGRAADAAAALASAESQPPAAERGNALAAALIRGELRMAAGDPAGALAAWNRADELAVGVDPVLGRMEALVGQAVALGALGRVDEALARHREADEVSLTFARFVPLFAGRDTFLAQRDRGARHAVALLLEAGRPAEAMEVVRRLRAEVLAGLAAARRLEALSADERATWDEAVEAFAALRRRLDEGARTSWTLPADELAAWREGAEALRRSSEAVLDGALSRSASAVGRALRPPAAGELLVTWFEDARGWVGLAAAGDGVLAWRIGALPTEPAALGEALFGALNLTGVERVTLMPWGALRDLDLHLLPVHGATLIDAAAVVWGLDVVGVEGASGGDAVIVADPRGDLPGARQEVAGVAAAVGPVVTRLEGAAATRSAVLASLKGAGLWHYAGHGEVDELGGARLLLAEEGELAVADVLSLAAVPGRVVLVGCETAAARAGGVEGLGLGQAFVVAGSGAAVASVRPVADDAAAAFTAALYRHGVASGSAAEAFRRAVREARAAGHDVGAFRLLVP
jgi:tetratricopeptide (TPR) repeat protein